MRKIQVAVLVIFFGAGLGSASAQTAVYKCANQYSDTPCPQAVAVKADDARSSTQQSQADASTKRTAAAGKELEKKRLAENAIATKAAPPQRTSKTLPEPKKEPLVVLKKPKLQTKEKSDAFVSQVPQAKKASP
jgi:hypothetical protein